jgi:prohibitin 1
VIAAEGDARAADLIGKALGDAGDGEFERQLQCFNAVLMNVIRGIFLGLIELRRIEAAEDIATQLSKSRNIVYLPHGPQMLLNISGGVQ